MTLRSGARSPRRERVGEQLREEISAMMLTEIKDPRVRLASISRVRVQPGSARGVADRQRARR